LVQSLTSPGAGWLAYQVGANVDVEKAKASRAVRAGKGKMRNRRYVARKGPLVVYANDEGVSRAFRNIPGVEVACVERLNLLQLAPGGHAGRFIVWTKGAVEKLNGLYGTATEKSTSKKVRAGAPNPNLY
jgi:large subunit ribosomal protein L4e